MLGSLNSSVEVGKPARAVRHDRIVFTLLLIAFLGYAALFIYRTSFVAGGERYFSLFDDAMVSMRYAKNLAHGYGLVWNPGGEHVEGYTNPLWVMYMSLVHLLPVAPSKTSLFIQITAAILLAINLYYVSGIALALSGQRLIAWAAVALTASYLPINNWSLQGMEVSVLVLLTTFCSWVAIQALENGAIPVRMYVLLGIGTFVRPDVVVPFAAYLMFLAAADPVHRRAHAAWGGLVLVAAITVQTLFRLAYYGDALPNTYYLKVAGVPAAVRIARGFYVLLQFVWKANVALFALPFMLALSRDRRIWLLLWILVCQMAYSVYVGGDAWEYWGGSNRYICIAMPGFFVLLAYALHRLATSFVASIRGQRQPPFAFVQVPALVFVLALGYAIVSVNSIYGVGALAEALLIRAPLHTGDGEENQQDVEQALAIRRATAADATIAVMRAGTIPYFADRRAIDLLGKSDRHVARGPARLSPDAGFREFRPGHVKFDFAYSIGQLRPDLIVQLRRREELAKPFLQDYDAAVLNGTCVYVRRASASILRGRLAAGSCGE